MTELTVIDQPAVAEAALSPIRRRLLVMLTSPASAAELAERLEMPRQRVGYHMRVLEQHGLIALDHVRQRRGFVERRYVRAGPVYLAPDLVDPLTGSSDDVSAEALVGAASDAIRAIGTHQSAGSDIPTATLDASVTFAAPADMRSCLEEIGDVLARHDRPSESGLTMKITVLAHPPIPGAPR